MIKPEDLRIGNWVNHYGETITVDGIDDIDVFNKKCGEIPLHSITPIPLTEKILLDCGFEEEYKSPFHSVYFKDGVSCYFWYDKKRQYLNISGLHIDCDNVHTLQNIYYLIKKTELIIKL